eukprot:361632-Chlamydomonas_euryale.AAC.4
MPPQIALPTAPKALRTPQATSHTPHGYAGAGADRPRLDVWDRSPAAWPPQLPCAGLLCPDPGCSAYSIQEQNVQTAKGAWG